MRRLFLISVALFLLVSMGFTAFSHHSSAHQPKTQPTVAENGENERVYLLVGVDEASYSSDVMMLARLSGGSLSFLQIPRDSLIASGNRLNAVFAAGCNRVKNEGGSDREAYLAGASALAERLSRALGVKITASATLTLAGLRRLVDAMGGVEVTLERDLSYEDPTQGLTISLSAGRVLLDGRAAEGLVRCRSAYPDADYGRMRAQRQFVRASFEKLRSAFTPLALFSLFRKAYGEAVTDLSLKDALSLVRSLFSSESALSFATLIGESYRHGGALVEVLSERNLEKAACYLGGNFEPSAARALFCYDEKGAIALYESKTPPAFLTG